MLVRGACHAGSEGLTTQHQHERRCISLHSIPPWEPHCGATQKGAQGSSLKGSYGSLEAPGGLWGPQGTPGGPQEPFGAARAPRGLSWF